MLTKNDALLIRRIVKEEINTELKPIRKQITKIDKKLDKTIDSFDSMHLDVVKNVRKIQSHVGLPVMDFA